MGSSIGETRPESRVPLIERIPTDDTTKSNEWTTRGNRIKPEGSAMTNNAYYRPEQSNYKGAVCVHCTKDMAVINFIQNQVPSMHSVIQRIFLHITRLMRTYHIKNMSNCLRVVASVLLTRILDGNKRDLPSILQRCAIVPPSIIALIISAAMLSKRSAPRAAQSPTLSPT
jgi:hypothetical protein